MTTSFILLRSEDGSRLVKKDHLKLNLKGKRLLNVWQCSTMSPTVEREGKSQSYCLSVKSPARVLSTSVSPVISNRLRISK